MIYLFILINFMSKPISYDPLKLLFAAVCCLFLHNGLVREIGLVIPVVIFSKIFCIHNIYDTP